MLDTWIAVRRSAETSPGRNSRVFPFFSSVICLVFSVSMELLFLNRGRIPVRSRNEDLKSYATCSFSVITARISNYCINLQFAHLAHHPIMNVLDKLQNHKPNTRNHEEKKKYRLTSAVVDKSGGSK